MAENNWDDSLFTIFKILSNLFVFDDRNMYFMIMIELFFNSTSGLLQEPFLSSISFFNIALVSKIWHTWPFCYDSILIAWMIHTHGVLTIVEMELSVANLVFSTRRDS